MPSSDHAWLSRALADPCTGWAFGTFGAIAEFTRDPGEPAALASRDGVTEVATDRGAIRLVVEEAIAPLAYETPNRDGETWSQAVALCLPAERAAMNRRAVLTELGPDREAVRPADRQGVLFDMGLLTGPVDVCIRTSDSALLATLREAAGRPLFSPGNPAMAAVLSAGPHRVFVGRLGRAEVFQPIPPADGRSPDGPHTHVLPKLLRSGRTHAATTPVPDGLVPCAHLFPPSPVRDAAGRRRAFDPHAHAGFQELFGRFGRPEAIRLKRDLAQALAEGRDPGDLAAAAAGDKHARGYLRVALRQLRALHPDDATLPGWAARLDRLPREGDDDEDEQPAH